MFQLPENGLRILGENVEVVVNLGDKVKLQVNLKFSCKLIHQIITS